MLEDRNRRYVELIRRGLGNAAVQNASTDVDLTNVRLLHKNPISDELTCSVVASSYNANNNTVNEGAGTSTLGARVRPDIGRVANAGGDAVGQ